MKSNQTKILSIGLLFSLLFTISDTIKSACSASAAAAAAAKEDEEEDEELFEDAIDFAAAITEEKKMLGAAAAAAVEEEEFQDATELSAKELLQQEVLLKYGINYEDGTLLDIAKRINIKALKNLPLDERIKDQELINFYIAVNLNNFKDEELTFLNTARSIGDILQRFDIEKMRALAKITIVLLNTALQGNVTNDSYDKHPISIADLQDPMIIHFLKLIPTCNNIKEATDQTIDNLNTMRKFFSRPNLTRSFLQRINMAPTKSLKAARIKQSVLLHNQQVKTANQRSEEKHQAMLAQEAAQERAEQARKDEKAAKKAKETKEADEKAAKKARKAEEARITKEARIAKEAEEARIAKEARSAKIAAIMAKNECSEKTAALMVDQGLPFDRARILADLD